MTSVKQEQRWEIKFQTYDIICCIENVKMKDVYVNYETNISVMTFFNIYYIYIYIFIIYIYTYI